jgi:hypothetical protein
MNNPEIERQFYRNSSILSSMSSLPLSLDLRVHMSTSRTSAHLSRSPKKQKELFVISSGKKNYCTCGQSFGMVVIQHLCSSAHKEITRTPSLLNNFGNWSSFCCERSRQIFESVENFLVTYCWNLPEK